MISTYSRVRASGFGYGWPYQPSTTCGPDAPRPRMARPPERWSRVSAVIATVVGVRPEICVTAVPSRMERVGGAVPRQRGEAVRSVGLGRPERVEAEILGRGDLLGHPRRRAGEPVPEHQTKLQLIVGHGWILTRTCYSFLVSMPTDVGIVDLMLSIPTGHEKDWYEFLKPQLREESKDYEFPVQYMFKDVPHMDLGSADPVDATLHLMDRYGIEKAMVGVGLGDPSRNRGEGDMGAVRQHPDRFIPSLNVDPNQGMNGVRDLVKAYETLGIKAATAFPAGCMPQVPINDKKFYPLYAKCIELDIPICVCTGICGPRVPSACQETMLIDEVCWYFPELKFVMRHGAEPWADVAAKLMLKWPNLYYSTSAFAPRYYPADDHRLRQHPRRRQGDVRRLLPDGPLARPHLPRDARRAVQGRRVAEVPARERRAGLQARGLGDDAVEPLPLPDALRLVLGRLRRGLPVGRQPRRSTTSTSTWWPGATRPARSTCRTPSARTSAPTSATAARSRAASCAARSTAGSSTPRAPTPTSPTASGSTARPGCARTPSPSATASCSPGTTPTTSRRPGTSRRWPSSTPASSPARSAPTTWSTPACRRWARTRSTRRTSATCTTPRPCPRSSTTRPTGTARS